MLIDKKEKGNILENKVEKELLSKNWKILIKNQIFQRTRTSKKVEFDIVAEKNNKIVVFECKNWNNVKINNTYIASSGDKRTQNIMHQLQRQFKGLVYGIGDNILKKQIYWCLIFNNIDEINLKPENFISNGIIKRKKWSNFPVDVYMTSFEKFEDIENYILNLKNKNKWFEEKYLRLEKRKENKRKELKLLQKKYHERLEARKILNSFKSEDPELNKLKKVIDLMHPYIYMDEDIKFKIKQIEKELK